MQAKLFPCTYAIPCDVYGCAKPAKWYVGRSDAPLNCTYKLCQSCAESVAKLMPAELQPAANVAAEKPVEAKPVLEQTPQAVVKKKTAPRKPTAKKSPQERLASRRAK